MLFFLSWEQEKLALNAKKGCGISRNTLRLYRKMMHDLKRVYSKDEVVWIAMALQGGKVRLYNPRTNQNRLVYVGAITSLDPKSTPRLWQQILEPVGMQELYSSMRSGLRETVEWDQVERIIRVLQAYSPACASYLASVQDEETKVSCRCIFEIIFSVLAPFEQQEAGACDFSIVVQCPSSSSEDMSLKRGGRALAQQGGGRFVGDCMGSSLIASRLSSVDVQNSQTDNEGMVSMPNTDLMDLGRDIENILRHLEQATKLIPDA